MLQNNLEIHLSIPPKLRNLKESSHRAFPLLDPAMPKINLSLIRSPAERIDGIYQVIDWLDVESCKRYLPDSNGTYCNIYAHDVGYLLGSYIPRVWWTEKYVSNVLAGECVDIDYEETVDEMNCNMIADWFKKYGTMFSWLEYRDLTIAQQVVNAGTFGVSIAKHSDPFCSGHITVILPECSRFKAIRIKAEVLAPLQSQAGRVNRKVFSDIWWREACYSEHMIWVYTPVYI